MPLNGSLALQSCLTTTTTTFQRHSATERVISYPEREKARVKVQMRMGALQDFPWGIDHCTLDGDEKETDCFNVEKSIWSVAVAGDPKNMFSVIEWREKLGIDDYKISTAHLNI